MCSSGKMLRIRKVKMYSETLICVQNLLSIRQSNMEISKQNKWIIALKTALNGNENLPRYDASIGDEI